MPTETKNSTAKASRSGSVSSAARWERGDSLSTMPAKKAPRAKETPNSLAEPKATPSAMASTARRNSSREPICATQCITPGMTRRPTTSISTTKPATLARVRARVVHTLSPPNHSTVGVATVRPPSAPDTAGSSTRARTMARSSTMSQPTAIRPCSLSTMRRSWSARSSTTVLATDRATPKTRPAPTPHPMPQASAMPMRVATAICTTAPGMAMARTDSRSLREKCRPTPNISRITPISASSTAMCESATKPGVNGPTITPAIR